MSYYYSNYYRNPILYTSSDFNESVPGWGLSPIAAGPARVGVGRTEDAMYQYTGCSSCAGLGQTVAEWLKRPPPSGAEEYAAPTSPLAKAMVQAGLAKPQPFPTWGYLAIAGGAALILVGGAVYLKRTGRI